MPKNSNIRLALTETRNAYEGMPATVERLAELADNLDELRTANLRHHEELIVTARAEGAQVIGLGELFSSPYFALSEDPMWLGLAEELDGPSVSWMRRVAEEQQMVIIAPIYELDPATDKRFNTAVVIDSDGRVLGSYRKTHIPRGTNETASFHETFYYDRSDGGMQNDHAPGDSQYFPVFSTAVAKVGVAICYDRHFEGVMSTLAGNGAEIVFSPAVTFGTKSEQLWPQEFQTDATRHGIVIGGSNRRGPEPPWNVEYFGRSQFWAPNGPLPNLSQHPNLVVSEIDRTDPATDPAGWNLERDRRPEIFG